MPKKKDSAPSAGRTIRADAEANRLRILAAAGELMAESGVNVPMMEVAKRAGTGIATLFRRFPTREALLAEVFTAKMQDYADAAAEALALPDAWEGFRQFVHRAAAMQARDLGFNKVLMMSFPEAPGFEAVRHLSVQRAHELVARARATGRLRADFVPQDLGILLLANAGLNSAISDGVPEASQRLVEYLLQAFEAPGRGPLPPPPVEGALIRAMGER